MLLAFTVEGYGVDMGCFGAWAGKMANGGPANFYEAGYFCDYPPAYMLVLWLLGLLGRALGLGTGSMAFQGLMKLSRWRRSASNGLKKSWAKARRWPWPRCWR